MPRKKTYQWNTEAEEHVASQPLSRSAKKRQSTALQKLGEQLAGLDKHVREALDLPPDLQEALRLYDTISNHEGRRRQMQYIGRIMREIDAAPIEAALAALATRHQADTALLHKAEQWRQRLLDAKEHEILSLLEQSFPEHKAMLHPLVEKARQETAGQAPHARRALFRAVLKALKEKVEKNT